MKKYKNPQKIHDAKTSLRIIIFYVNFFMLGKTFYIQIIKVGSA